MISDTWKIRQEEEIRGGGGAIFDTVTREDLTEGMISEPKTE